MNFKNAAPALIALTSVTQPTYAQSLSTPVASITCHVDSELGQSTGSAGIGWVCGQIYGQILCEYDAVTASGDVLNAHQYDPTSSRALLRLGSPSRDRSLIAFSVEVFESDFTRHFLFTENLGRPGNWELQQQVFDLRSVRSYTLAELEEGVEEAIVVPEVRKGRVEAFPATLRCSGAALN